MFNFSISSTQMVMFILLLVVTIVVCCLLVAYGKREAIGHLREKTEEANELFETCDSLRLRLGLAIQRKNEAYTERNMLVTFLLRVLQTENIEGWEVKRGYTPEFKDWEDVVYVRAPAKYGLPQMSWHFRHDQGPLLDSLGLPDGGKWDGTTTEQKYTALREFFMSGALAGRISAAGPYESDGTAPIESSQ